ncbi:glycoside hydrolase family 16 protein [Dyadobacter luticola]|uniref:Glycoside hydrolase family 16 protein n=1 Tax=Dyadobacter luticola TaxID=1979387 RepID=A0A5R9KX51_9BACT|nr:glycoside hydrolase family 16 protein [Dyadobacter luticola]TLV00834.1 glycoside hydrolase family 16 protein [Dyadobacter luticola]
MKNLLCLILIFFATLTTTFAQWKLVWSDEFDKDGAPDPANWSAEKGFTRNHEAQWFQEENAFCKDGYLIIEARKEQVKNPKFVSDSKNWKEHRKFAAYTSASLITRGKHSWQYGRWEMKARIDTRLGLWPAFWTLGTQGEWPDNGEIDIMEFYRGTLLANLAWGSNEQYKPVWNSVKTPITTFNDPEWSKKFHVWRMDWDEQSVKLYVDDQLLATQDNPKGLNLKNKNIEPFHQPHYMLLTLAVAGDNGGDPANTTFPARFEIDYVRVFQKK